MQNNFSNSINKISLKILINKHYLEFVGILFFGFVFTLYIIITKMDFKILNIYIPVLFLSLLLLAVRLYLTIRKNLLNYTIEVNDNSITVNNVIINYNDIISINENLNGDLIINTNNSFVVIYKDLTVFNQLKQQLSINIVITKENKNKKIITIVALLLLPVFIFIKISYIVIPLGLFLGIYYIKNTYILFKSKVTIFIGLSQLLLVLFIIYKTFNYIKYLIITLV